MNFQSVLIQAADAVVPCTFAFSSKDICPRTSEPSSAKTYPLVLVSYFPKMKSTVFENSPVMISKQVNTGRVGLTLVREQCRYASETAGVSLTPSNPVLQPYCEKIFNALQEDPTMFFTRKFLENFAQKCDSLKELEQLVNAAAALGNVRDPEKFANPVDIFTRVYIDTIEVPPPSILPLPDGRNVTVTCTGKVQITDPKKNQDNDDCIVICGSKRRYDSIVGHMQEVWHRGHLVSARGVYDAMIGRGDFSPAIVLDGKNVIRKMSRSNEGTQLEELGVADIDNTQSAYELDVTYSDVSDFALKSIVRIPCPEHNGHYGVYMLTSRSARGRDVLFKYTSDESNIYKKVKSYSKEIPEAYSSRYDIIGLCALYPWLAWPWSRSTVAIKIKPKQPLRWDRFFEHYYVEFSLPEGKSFAYKRRFVSLLQCPRILLCMLKELIYSIIKSSRS
jgi:hypothetical protein